MEAQKLAGIKINKKNDGIDAARRIKSFGARNVIIKGGHFNFSSDVIDTLLDHRGKIIQLSNPRIKTKNFHGSGCNFSSALTAYLAKGETIFDSFRKANEHIYNAITNTLNLGKGLPIVNPIYSTYRDAERYHVLTDLQRAVEKLIALDGFYRFIPETQTNFGYALSDANTILDVAAVRGRIVKSVEACVATSYVQFGASRHIAAAIIAYMARNSSFRSAINIRFDKRLLEICKSISIVEEYNRTKEPSQLKMKEGTTVAWGTSFALSKNPRAEIIYHRGDIGKEPMITIFGRSPYEVLEKVISILKKY
jgi:hydroxymethylpyrimidine/phosphomethylpyrimidine kinase